MKSDTTKITGDLNFRDAVFKRRINFLLSLRRRAILKASILEEENIRAYDEPGSVALPGRLYVFLKSTLSLLIDLERMK